MAQSSVPALQNLGFYQLENLVKSQAKFLMVVITDDGPDAPNEGRKVPSHPMLRTDIVTDAASASSKIQQMVELHQLPVWWPYILISENGAIDAAVGESLAPLGLINVYSYRGGWKSLLAGT